MVVTGKSTAASKKKANSSSPKPSKSKAKAAAQTPKAQGVTKPRTSKPAPSKNTSSKVSKSASTKKSAEKENTDDEDSRGRGHRTKKSTQDRLERESLKIRINPQKRKALQDALDQEDDNDAAPAPKKRKNRQVEPESPLRLTPPAPSKTIPMKYFESPRHASHSQHSQAFRHRSPSRSPTRRSPPPRHTSYSRHPSRGRSPTAACGRSPTPARGRSPTPAAQGQAFSRRSRTPSWSPTPPPGVTHGYKHSHAVIRSDPIDDGEYAARCPAADIALLEEDHDTHGGITDKSQFLGMQGNDHLNTDVGSTFDPEEEEGVKASNDEADEENQGDHDPDQDHHDPDKDRERLRAQWEEYRRSKQQRQQEREQSGKGKAIKATVITGGSVTKNATKTVGASTSMTKTATVGVTVTKTATAGASTSTSTTKTKTATATTDSTADLNATKTATGGATVGATVTKTATATASRNATVTKTVPVIKTVTATATAGRNTGASATKTTTKTAGLGDVEGPPGMKTDQSIGTTTGANMRRVLHHATPPVISPVEQAMANEVAPRQAMMPVGITKNRATRPPNPQKLASHARRQQAAEVRDDREDEDQDQDQDEEEEEEEETGGKRKRKPRTSTGFVTSLHEGFYPRFFRIVFDIVKLDAFEALLNGALYPGYDRLLPKIMKWLTDAICYCEEELELIQPDNIWEEYQEDMAKLIWNFIPTFRGRGRDEARKMVTHVYKILPTVDDFNGDGFGQAEYADKVKDNVEKLLDDYAFLKNGLDNEGHTNNLMAPAICELTYRLVHAGQDSVAKALPHRFKIYTGELIAAMIVFLHVAIEEYATGEFRGIRFTEPKYGKVYEDALHSIAHLKGARDQRHWEKTRAEWAKWEVMNTITSGKTAAGPSSGMVKLD
ncbi:hypothetical protein B0H16DRAFT_1768735 [Mycena metata]|uniref:DUF6532 domain-containing protein n=1 Tax=Mycena metata TaxID=1033252 RepID=A0AAD7NRS8_9AGAR|nr:hypothetical protein B0H16DRAFT_1768735 [Mycena metata]